MTVDHTSHAAPRGPDAGLRRGTRETIAALSNPVSLKGLIAATAGGVVLLLPSVTNLAVDLAVFVSALLMGGVELWYSLGGKRRKVNSRTRIIAAARGIMALLFAAVMAFLVIVTQDGASLGVSLLVAVGGLYLAFRGIVFSVAALVQRGKDHRAIRLAGGVAATALGALAFVAPDSVSDAILAGAAVSALVLGLLLVAWGLRRADGAITRIDPVTATPLEVIWDWVRGSDVGDIRREELGQTLYLESPERLSKRIAWWTMLVLSVAIATYAVLADSTAVVIGAMLVAPLMAPILGLAGAIVNGWRQRSTQAAIQVTIGVIVSIALAYGLSAWTLASGSIATNSQITSRVNPNTIDMLIAIAAGAAGAFATVDKRVSSSIAGVAIAVALVPPLAVVGICLQAGYIEDASGAFLLFLTNFVAIVLSAAVVFVLMGFARYSTLKTHRNQILVTVVPFVALACLVLVPLMFTSEGIVNTAQREDRAEEVVTDWLGQDTDLLIESIDAQAEEVTVSLIGADTPPSIEDLQSQLEDAFVRPVALTVRVIPVRETTLPASD